jgi:hypothetical protein
MKRVNALLNRSVPTKPEQIPASTELRTFTHKPLDETKPSLRLITVNSELSADGLIQCYVSHSTLDRASYVCLSYQWGPPQRAKRIHINGAPFYVRSNLFDFLELVRRMPMTFYWIDAICIDQDNIYERNYQVSRMGQIFSGAFLVYLWLGSLPTMAHYMHYLKKAKAQHTSTMIALDAINDAHKIVGTCVFNNEYWSRAWVTQEIVLARSVVVLLCGESFKISDLVSARLNFDNIDLGSFRDCAMTRFAQVVDSSAQLPLLHLIDKLRDSQCEIFRDRIYSLLSLSSDNQLPGVDYEQTSEDLAYEVLTLSDGALCVCSALLVAQTLNLSNEKCCGDPPLSDSATMLEFEIKGLRYDRHVMLANDIVQSWAHYKLVGTDIFGHDYVFSHFCPVFEILMDALQARAKGTGHVSTIVADSSSPSNAEPPFLLRSMDTEHAQAFLHGFEPALTTVAHNTNRDICTISVSLGLLAELVPESVSLCPRVGHQKEKFKVRNSAELNSTSERDGSSHRMLPAHRPRKDSKKQSVDLRRVDSANPSKNVDDEGAVSQLRIWRTQDKPG